LNLPSVNRFRWWAGILGWSLLVTAGALQAKKIHVYPVPLPLTKPTPEIVSFLEVKLSLALPVGVRPRFDDASYAKLDHQRLPVFLDWLEQTVAHLQERQLKQDDTPMVHNVRHSRMMRVMSDMAQRSDDSFPAAAMFIGFVQVRLDQPWGGRDADELVDLTLVGTDQGLFLIDLDSRTIRPYDKKLQALTHWLHL
jgi:hypothetical protein